MFVACGGILREVGGNITGPTNRPFNETSYVCHWTLEPPNMFGSANNSLTMTLKVSGYLGGENVSNTRRNCGSHQYIGLLGKIRYFLDSHYRLTNDFIFYVIQIIHKKEINIMINMSIENIIVDIEVLCGNITEPVYLRSPKLVNELTVMYNIL